MQLASFLSVHPVFTLKQAVHTLRPTKNRRAMIDRLKHHVRSRKLKQVTRGVYAVVTPGLDAVDFRPDPFLVGLALRSDAVFSHHSALELLGASHTAWKTVTLFSARRRKTLAADGVMYSVTRHPSQMLDQSGLPMGTRKVERRGLLLVVTCPERTLVEGFRKPALVGGLEELVNSAAGFPVLVLDLLRQILDRYRTARLWATVGWFLERFRHEFHVPEELLVEFKRRRPAGPQYADRKSRGGTFVKRWNLILPTSLANMSEPNEPQPRVS